MARYSSSKNSLLDKGLLITNPWKLVGQLTVNFSKSGEATAPPTPLVLPALHCIILPCFQSTMLFVWLIIARGTFFNRESYNRYHFVGKKIAIPMKVDSRHVIYLYRAGGSGCAGFVTILSKYQALARTIWIYVLMGIPLVL